MNDTSDFYSLMDSLDAARRLAVEFACSKVSFGPQQIIYQQGTEPDALYVVESGAVEAVTFSPDGQQSRVVAVMNRGDFFGDLAIFTQKPRLATIRTREATIVLRIDKDAFLRLLKTLPEMGHYFCLQLAQRLFRTSTEAHHSVYAIDLTGNLKRFDLLTIVQAVTGMGHTGELTLKSSANEILGTFFFQHGRVEYARFRHLLGLEAIWQGFAESATEGTFHFKAVPAPTATFPKETKLEMDSTNLLLTGVGKRDAYQALPETLRQMEGQLTRVAEKLEWKDPESKELAGRIWEQIASGAKPLLELWMKTKSSAMTFLEVVMELGMSGQAELLVPATEAEKEALAKESEKTAEKEPEKAKATRNLPPF